MENIKSDKIERILGIYTKLIHGHVVNKVEEHKYVHVLNEQESIERDIDKYAPKLLKMMMNEGILSFGNL